MRLRYINWGAKERQQLLIFKNPTQPHFRKWFNGEVCLLDEARRTDGYHGRNEEEDFDDHFPGNAGIGAFDDDIPMREPEVDVAENDPSDDLGAGIAQCAGRL